MVNKTFDRFGIRTGAAHRPPDSLGLGLIQCAHDGGKHASRIGRAGVSRHVKGLAATAAKVDRPAFTGSARIRQPSLAAKLIEAGGVVPNIFEGALRDIVKMQSRQCLREMTGECEPFRIYHHEPAAPSLHTRLGVPRIIVGRDEEYVHGSPEAHPGIKRNGSRPFDLLAGGEERDAVLESPPEILRIRQLKPVGGHQLGQSDQVRDFVDVVSMEHDVQGQRKFERVDPPHDFELSVEGWCSGDAVRFRLPRALDGDLHAVEATGLEARQPLEGQRDAARDQVGIEIEPARSFYQPFEVIPQQRFASCQVNLDHTERFRLLKDSEPCAGIELDPAAREIERVRTIGTPQRTTVGELGD